MKRVIQTPYHINKGKVLLRYLQIHLSLFSAESSLLFFLWLCLLIVRAENSVVLKYVASGVT